MDDTNVQKPEENKEDENLNPENQEQQNAVTFDVSEMIDNSSEVKNGETPNASVMSLLDIESAIKTRITQLERFREDIKPIKEMLESYLDADLEYAELTEAAKEAAKKKSSRKKDLLSTPNGKEIMQKMDAIKDKMKEYQESLSYYLAEYQKMTGANEIEGEDGELRQIVYVAKLVRKTNLQRD